MYSHIILIKSRLKVKKLKFTIKINLKSIDKQTFMVTMVPLNSHFDYAVFYLKLTTD